MSDNTEYLALKWGTVKGWKVSSDASRAALARYLADDVSMSAIQQHDTPEQKQALCDLIDAIDGEIYNDWSGEKYTKDQAKAYVREYGAPKTTEASA